MRAKLCFDSFIFLSLLLLGAFLGSHFMYEFKWDFTNYHYYGPWALLNDRIGYDIAPASVNTYFNPLIDIPFYFLTRYFNDYPQFISAVQGLYYGLLLFVFYKICLLFFSGDNWQRFAKIGLAMLIGGSGYAVFMQISTTTNEIQIGILVLWGFYLLVKILKDEKEKATAFIWPGLILGMAMGLKLTAVIYCIAAGGSLILLSRQIRSPIAKISVFAVSGVVGFLIVNGYWMWLMWQHFGNPFFPFANAIFKSEYYPLFNFSDTRYLPKNYLQFLFYPFYWIYHNQRYVGEMEFIDPRFAILQVIGLVWLIMFFRGKTQTSFQNRFLYLFMFLSYVAWLSCFSIIRYLLPIEMLAAIVFVQALWLLKITKSWQQILFIPLIIILIYIMMTVANQSDEWGSRRGDNKIIDMEKVTVQDDSLIILYSMPSAALGTILADSAHNVRLVGTLQCNAVEMKGTDFSNEGEFHKIKDKLISGHRGDILALVRFWCSENCLRKISEDKLLGDMYCRKLQNNLDDNIFICRSQKWFDDDTKGLTEEMNNNLLFVSK